MRSSRWLLLFTKPPLEGYAAQLPPCQRRHPGHVWRQAMTANAAVREVYTPDAERYEQWYKETYHLNDVRDGSAASGASSNRKLDDSHNLQTLREYDLEAVEEEAYEWGNQYTYSSQLM
eukprot:gene10209-7153_t